MKKNQFKQTGFTLVELMIVVVIVGIFIAVVGGALASGCGIGVSTRKANAEKYATTYMRRFYQSTNPIVDCQGTDSDNNGYVTCTVSTGPGATTHTIECNSNLVMEFNQGCRAAITRDITGVDQ